MRTGRVLFSVPFPLIELIRLTVSIALEEVAQIQVSQTLTTLPFSRTCHGIAACL